MTICSKCGQPYEGKACKPCKKAYQAAYYATNKNRFAAYVKGRREIINTRRVAIYAEHPQKIKAQQAAWRAKNPEKARAISQKWRKANPELAKELWSKWAAANIDVRRINWHNSRAKRKGISGKLSRGLIAKLLESQGGKCACCNADLGYSFTIDHKIPLSRGGVNEDWNIQLLTQTCNNRKRNKLPDEFEHYKAELRQYRPSP